MQGGTAYAIVQTDFISTHVHHLHERGVYEFTRFVVCSRPLILNPIQTEKMIVFSQSTMVNPRFDLDIVLPTWTTRLTPIDELPLPNDTPDNYIGKDHAILYHPLRYLYALNQRTISFYAN